MRILSGKMALFMAFVLGVGAFGGWNLLGRSGGETPENAPIAVMAPVPENALPTEEKAVSAEKAPVTPAADPESAEVPTLRPIAFDEVRREVDGMTIIAGRAHPGAEVLVKLDGEALVETKADGGGKFATITMIAPDGQGHVLSLLQIVQGQTVESDNEIILAPLSPPVQVAESTPPEPPAPETQQNAPEGETPTQEPLETAALDPAPTALEPRDDQAPAPLLTELNNDVSVASAEQTASENAGSQQAAQGAVAQVGATETPLEAAPQQAPSSPEVASSQPTEAAPDVAGNAPARLLPQAGVETDAPNIAPQRIAAATQIATGPVLSRLDGASLSPERQPQTARSAPRPVSLPQVAVLKSSAEGVELLNGAGALTNVALDTISYADNGNVRLSGRAQSAARHVQVYLNNASVVRLAVDAQGRWRGDLPDVNEGIYTLRVDEVSVDGNVTSRVETPFKREAPEVLARVAAAAADGPLKQITVQKGATLWAIARDRYGDGLLYVNVFQANADTIRDPDLIYPGQVFALPD